MRRLHVVTNALLAVIAISLVLIVLGIYGIGTHAAYAAPPTKPQPVVLMYWDDDTRSWQPVVGQNGVVPTSK